MRTPDLRSLPVDSRTVLAFTLGLGASYAVLQPPFAVAEESEQMAVLAELAAFGLRSPSDADGNHYHAIDPELERLISSYEPRAFDWRARVSLDELAQDLAAPAGGAPVQRAAQPPRLGRLSALPLLPGFWTGQLLGLSMLGQLYLARLGSALCFAFLAVWATRTAGRLGAAFFALASLPATLMQAGGVSGEALGYGLVLCFFALIAKGSDESAGRGLTPRERLLLLGLLPALVMCQPFMLAAILCLMVPPADGRTPPLLRGPRFLALGLGLSCLALLVWFQTNTPPFAIYEEASPSAQWPFLAAHPLKALFDAGRSLLREVDSLVIEFSAFSGALVDIARFSGSVIAVIGCELVLLLALGVNRQPRGAAARRQGWLIASLIVYGLATLLCAQLTQNKPHRTLLHVVPTRTLALMAPLVVLALAGTGRPGFGRFLRARPKLRIVLPMLLLNAIALATILGRYYVPWEREWPY